MQLESLIGRRLMCIEVYEAWAQTMPKHDAPPQGEWELSGALAIRFGSGSDGKSLLCTSPLRYLRHQQGTVFGLASGNFVSLGYRVTVCDSADASALLPFTMEQQGCSEYWPLCRKTTHPAVGQVLVNIGVEACQRMGRAQDWGIELTFASDQNLRLSYRSDLDGSIELAAPGEHYHLERIVVERAEQNFGWLHPAAPLDFILDDQVWRSAKVAHWPHALRKALQSHHDPDAIYHQTMRRALTARFRQRPLHLQRLLALRYPVNCADVPAGLIEEVAASFQQRTTERPESAEGLRPLAHSL